MKQEIIQQIKQYQEENSNIKLSQDQFQQIIQQIETKQTKKELKLLIKFLFY